MLPKEKDFWKLSFKVDPCKDKERTVSIIVRDPDICDYEVKFKEVDSLKEVHEVREQTRSYYVQRLPIDDIMEFLFEEGFKDGNLEYDVVSCFFEDEEDFAFFVRRTLDEILYEFRQIMRKHKLTMFIEVLDPEELDRRVCRVVCMKEVYEFILKHPHYAGICVSESKTNDDYNRAYLIPEEEIPTLKRILDGVHTRPYKYGLAIDDEEEIYKVNDEIYELDEQKRIFEISEWETSRDFGFISCQGFLNSIRK